MKIVNRQIRHTSIAILGDGGWGTSLAILLCQKGFPVTMWGAFDDYIFYLKKKRVNTKFLPGVRIPNTLKLTSNLEDAVKDKKIVILAIPSQYMRSIIKKVKILSYLSSDLIFISVTKGIEVDSLKRMSEVIYDELGKVNLAVLSGPTIAQEVAKGIPTTAVIASRNKEIRKYLQNVFITPWFRIYTNDDVTGVELGGSIKNVIAIACGISDGLGFGTNTKAALLSRGLAEISRLGYAMGARENTFSGISGLGDLVTTCISQYSRNRFVGEQIGKGKTLQEIKKRMQMIAEGVTTAKSAHLLGLKYKVDMPITEEVYSVLYENKSPLKAVKDLMRRERKEE